MLMNNLNQKSNQSMSTTIEDNDRLLTTKYKTIDRRIKVAQLYL